MHARVGSVLHSLQGVCFPAHAVDTLTALARRRPCPSAQSVSVPRPSPALRGGPAPALCCCVRRPHLHALTPALRWRGAAAGLALAWAWASGLVSPARGPLGALGRRWELQYTTLQPALGAGRLGLRPNGPIFQTIDMFSLLLLNEARFAAWLQCEPRSKPQPRPALRCRCARCVSLHAPLRAHLSAALSVASGAARGETSAL